MRTIIQSSPVLLLVVSTMLWAVPVSAQFQSQANDELKVDARFHIQTGSDQGFLIVKLEIPEGNYIYSMTQKAPLKPSKLVVKSSRDYVVGKKFKADKPPKVIERDEVFQARVEKHQGTVQFYVPIRLATVNNVKNLQPEVTFSGQVCSVQGYCVPVPGITAKAKFAGFFERQAKNSVPPLKQKK